MRAAGGCWGGCGEGGRVLRACGDGGRAALHCYRLLVAAGVCPHACKRASSLPKPCFACCPLLLNGEPGKGPPGRPFSLPITMRRAAAQLVQVLARGAVEAPGAAKVSNSCAAAALLARRGFADDASLLKTPLYDFHVANGGAPGRCRRCRRRLRRSFSPPDPAACWHLSVAAASDSAGGVSPHGLRLCWGAQRHRFSLPSRPWHPPAAGVPPQARWSPLPAGRCPFSTRTGEAAL